MGIHQVHDQIQITMDRLILSQLWLHFIKPVDQGLQCIHELAREEQGFFQLVLPEEKAAKRT